MPNFGMTLISLAFAMLSTIACRDEMPVRAELIPHDDFAPPVAPVAPPAPPLPDPPPDPSSATHETERSEPPTRAEKPPADVTVEQADPRINLNTATRAELERLPGIGPAMAARILTYREKREFRRVRDLRRIRGIGPAKLRKLEALVRVD